MGLTRIRAQQISDIDYKQAVRVVTTTDVTLSGGAPATVDGVNLQVNDRILVTAQDPGSENGIYRVQTLGLGENGTWVRTTDANETGEIQPGMVVMVTEGESYADTPWKLVTNGNIIIGETALTFQQFATGSGTPGGSNTQIQFNSANTFAGSADLTWDSTELYVNGDANITGNVTAAYFIGDGSLLTGISGGGGSFGVTALDFVGDGSTQAFAITEGYTANTVMVFENGVAQAPITDYTVSGNTLTFVDAPGSGVVIQARLFSGDSGNAANVDLSAVSQDIIPAANITYDLGNSTNRWNDIWLANSTIYLGETSISSSGQELILPAQVAIGNATIDGSSGGLVLPANSTIGGAAVATPRISAIDYPGDDTAADPAGGQTIGVAGSGFQNGASIIVDGTTASVVTFVSDTELQFVSAARAAGSYTVYVVNPDGGTGIYVPGMQYSGVPAWQSPPAGSLGEIYETQAIANTFVATSDSTVTYSLFSGTLPPGSTLNSATGTLSGTANLTAGNPVTYNFTIRATDAELQDTDRSFSLTIDPDVITWASPTDGGVVTVAANVASSTALVATSAVGSAIDYSANALPTGLSLSGNTIAGTATVLGNTSVALTATGNTTTRSSTITVTFVVELGNDPYFNQTVLLLSADSSPSFISDASDNSFNITPVGDTRPSAFSPYNTAWSNYFDGTGDYLSAPDNNDWQISTDYTIEAWVYPTGGAGTARGVVNHGDSGTSYWYLGINTSNQLDFNEYTGGSFKIPVTIAGTVPLNTWTHVAVVINGSTVTCYVNGVAGTSTTKSGTSGNYAGTLKIGTNVLGNGNYFTGYISNLRIVKGTAVYTSNFTPPTQPLTAIAGTSLLTCQSNRFVDNSTNNFAITRNGDVRVTAFAPFADTDTATGSGYFDGTGDYLSIADNVAFTLGSNDWTLEFWCYPTSTARQALYTQIDSGGTNASSSFYTEINSTSKWRFTVCSSSTSYEISSSANVVINAWTHLAFVRNGNTATLYVNGSSVGTVSLTGVTVNDSSQPVNIGSYGNSGSLPFSGYISNCRLVVGTAVYPTNFTPPTTPLTAIAGTSLLTLQNRISYNNSQFVDTSGNSFNITRAGNTTQGTFSPFSVGAGEWSNYFDGTGDYLTVPDNAALELGSSNFTVEAWVYLAALPALSNRIVEKGTSAPNISYIMGINSSGVFFFNFSENGTDQVSIATSASTITANQWYHLAATRSGSTFTIWVNGVSSGTTTSSLTIKDTTSTLRIANNFNDDRFLNGYISNLRIVKGTAVYTSTFTPPTEPLTAISGTSLLTCQSNRFVDNSTNAFAITRNGDVRVTPFSPFAPAAAYSPSVNGGSGYFDGTGDYLSVSDNAAFDLGSGEFTVEGWFYRQGGGNRIGSNILNQSVSGASSNSAFYFGAGSDGLSLYLSTNGSSWTNNIETGVAPALNAWSHCVWQRRGNTLEIYLNGILQTVVSGSSSFSGTIFNSSRVVEIGAQNASGTVNGYLSNLRLVKGTAVYTSNFTPPTAPPTAVANTSLLLNFTNAGIIDATGRNNFETLGNARLDTSFKKYGTGSISLPNTTSGTSRLIAAHAPWLNFPGAFTFEAWVYPTNLSGVFHSILGKYGSWYWGVYGGANSGLVRLIGAGGSVVAASATGAVVVNQWQHLALTRDSSNNLRIFVNGTQSGSTSNSSDSLTNVVNLSIGTYAPDQTGYDWRGYIDDLRITQGIARYTTNFTPPTEPFPQS